MPEQELQPERYADWGEPTRSADRSSASEPLLQSVRGPSGAIGRRLTGSPGPASQSDLGEQLASRALAASVVRAVSEEERCLVLGDADTAGWLARRSTTCPSSCSRRF